MAEAGILRRVEAEILSVHISQGVDWTLIESALAGFSIAAHSAGHDGMCLVGLVVGASMLVNSVFDPVRSDVIVPSILEGYYYG